MAYIVTIAEAAEGDIREAFLWYEGQQEQLGQRFAEHFEEAVNTLKDFPYKNQVRYGNNRIFFLQTFPFGIHYTITGNNILILGVFHTSLSPDKWKRTQ